MDTPRDTGLAATAAAIGEPSRAAMLTALLGGEWLTAGELARRAGVGASTASDHLARMVEQGLIVQRRAGRHRYFSLAGEDVAAALESLQRVATSAASHAARSEPQRALRFARTCYDHLAGTVGVGLTEAMRAHGVLAGAGLELTSTGAAWLRELDIDVDALRRQRRALTRACLDWSERRDHVAGAVGAALVDVLLARRWIARMPGTRAVSLTVRGRDGLHRMLGVELPQVE